MSKFSEKVAVVTGAGRGIGNAIAKKLASEGAKIAAISRSVENPQSCAEEINSEFHDVARSYSVDVSNHDDMMDVGKKILNDFGKVDILVNNAGVTRDNLMLRMNEDEWDAVLNTNLKGAFNSVKAFQRSLLKQGGARIINISSVIGLIGNAGQANYAASKAGLIGLTKSLGKELADKNIAVNAVTPAGAKTKILDQMSKEHVQWMLSKVPRGRFLEIKELTSLICWLSSEENSFSTAAVFDISGGRSTY